MNVPQQIVELMYRRIASVRKADPQAHPLIAIPVATLEASFQSGLLEPLHISVTDSRGNAIRATIKQGVIKYTDDSTPGDLRFPLQVVVTDEASTDKLEVYVETEEDEPDWIFHIRVL
jgi:hypothetical protein